MGKKLAIAGHPTRGKEVIELLEMLGGINDREYIGTNTWKDEYYFLDNGYIRAYDWCDGIKFTLEGFWMKYPYKVGDKVVYEDDNDIVVISEIIWDDTVGDIFYNVKRIDEDDCFLCPPELLKPYKGIQSDNMEIETHRGYYTTEEDTTNKSKKVAWFTFLDNDFADKVELNLNDRELIQENGKWFVVKKKPTYPNNFDDCFNTVADELNDNKDIEYFEYKYDLLDKFKQLLICRDAYWKIAGEKLELDKPWKPDWNGHEFKYGLKFMGHRIEKTSEMTVSHVLCFPTEEMRDAFYENFKDLIEQCKELL